ncbi:MAG TPA: Bax inhibitor-1/YccA family protein [Terriglobales bacterium]
MALFSKTSNPALRADSFRGAGISYGDTMTMPGTVNKTGILLLCAIATSAWTWNRFHTAPESVGPLILAGTIGGFIVGLVTIFKKQWSPITAPLYALLEGLVLGSISSMLELRYPGIAIQAIGLTFGTLIALLIAYSARIVRVTDKFRLGVVAATGGIALFYLVEFILGFFGIRFTAVNGSGLIGIGFSVFVVIIAALNLILDFDLIESGARAGAPKYMEWYGGFALMVTLIWLYMEVLRLLVKLRSRD